MSVMPGVDEIPARRSAPELLLAPFFYRVPDSDWAKAWACGGERLKGANQLGLKDRFGDNSHLHHAYGALGEITVARFLGIRVAKAPGCWGCPQLQHKDRAGRPDIMSDTFGPFEVRTMPPGPFERNAKGYLQGQPYLKTTKKDLDAVPIVFVVLYGPRAASGSVPLAVVHGWALPAEIRASGELQDWGNRGAPSWMTYDLSILHTTFRPMVVSSSPVSATDATATSQRSPNEAAGDGPSAHAAKQDGTQS